jgi:hypothetical protein
MDVLLRMTSMTVLLGIRPKEQTSNSPWIHWCHQVGVRVREQLPFWEKPLKLTVKIRYRENKF